MATRYDGLIIPRTYNDYFPRSAPNEIVEVLKNSGEVWPVESGGTGANNAAEARENLGIIVDDALDATSENPVQNKVLTALIPEDSTGLVDIGDFNALSDDVADIAEKIPTQASATNQLADKDFVNSSISTNTANYIYKTNAAGDHIPFDSVEELEAYSGTVTPNDYAIVTGIDENGNIYYDRYKANVSGGVVTWGKEYRLNNSSFTAEQWAAIQSGITAELVALIGQASGSSPIGTILPYIGSSAPAGFLFFDGNDYNGEDYPQLYAKVRNLPAFASETDGYFKLPNLAGRVLQGATIENLGELIAAGLPDITGEFDTTGIVTSGGSISVVRNTKGCYKAPTNISPSSYGTSESSKNAGIFRIPTKASLGETKTDGTLKTADEPHVYGNSDTVQPAALAINYMIKATNTNDALDAIIDDSTTDVGHAWSGEKVSDFVGQQSLKYNRPAYENQIVINVTDKNEHEYTCPQDGLFIYNLAGYNKDYSYIKINGFMYTRGGSDGSGYALVCEGSFSVRKGDIISYKTGDTNAGITLNQVIFVPYSRRVDEPIRNGIQYQIGEVDTGNTWVDGKPIYKNIIENVATSNVRWNTDIFNKISVLDIDTPIDIRGIYTNRTRLNCELQFDKSLGLLTRDAEGLCTIIFEYTKTTD